MARKKRIKISEDMEEFQRINIVLKARHLLVLDKIAAISPSHNRSSLIRIAIQEKFFDQERVVRDKMRHHQQELMRYKDKLKLIQERKG